MNHIRTKQNPQIPCCSVLNSLSSYIYIRLDKRKEVHCNSYFNNICYTVEGNKSEKERSRENVCSSYTWRTNDLDDPITSTSHIKMLDICKSLGEGSFIPRK